jgi:hypothetical protein
MTSDTVDIAGLDAAEDRLQRVVAANNATGLALALHDRLLATAPDGRLTTKEEDIAGYASNSFSVHAYEQVRRRTIIHKSTGVTAVRAHIRGRMNGDDFDVMMDYTRTWVHDDGRWQVLAAHLSPVMTSA